MVKYMDISHLRKEYRNTPLRLNEVEKDPIEQFIHWLNEALDAKVHEPNAMVLATVGVDGAPSTRTVLLKGIEAGQLLFYTHYTSRKGEEDDLVFPSDH